MQLTWKFKYFFIGLWRGKWWRIWYFLCYDNVPKSYFYISKKQKFQRGFCDPSRHSNWFKSSCRKFLDKMSEKNWSSDENSSLSLKKRFTEWKLSTFSIFNRQFIHQSNRFSFQFPNPHLPQHFPFFLSAIISLCFHNFSSLTWKITLDIQNTEKKWNRELNVWCNINSWKWNDKINILMCHFYLIFVQCLA